MKHGPREKLSLINFDNELKAYNKSGSKNNNAEETKRKKNPKKSKRVIYIKFDSDDDEGHDKDQTRNMTEGNEVEVERNTLTIRKKITHYYDLSSEDDSKLG